MASNFDFPSKSAQMLLQNERNGARKATRRGPFITKMTESNRTGGNTNTATNSPLGSDLMTNDGSVLSNNITLDLSVLLGMCGSGSLPYQLTPNPAGSILPFGLFPFGLATPGGSGVRSIIDPTSIPLVAKTPTKRTNVDLGSIASGNTHTSGDKMAASQTSSLNQTSRTANSNDAIHTRQSFPISNVASKDHGFVQNLGYPQMTGIFSYNKNRLNGVSLNRMRRQINQNNGCTLARTSPETVSTTSAITNTESKVETRPQNQKIATTSKNLCYRDAEAAAILLGMANSVPITTHQTNNSRNKRASESDIQFVTAKLGRYEASSTSPKTTNNLSPEGAEKVTINSLKPPLKKSHPSPSVKSTSTFKHSRKIPSARSIYDNNSINAKKKKQICFSEKISNQSSFRRERLHIRPMRKKSDALTSVVSHLPSCICAFDNPSQIKNGTINHRTEPSNAQYQHIATGGFNFKKVICKKFGRLPNPSGISENYQTVAEFSLPHNINTMVNSSSKINGVKLTSATKSVGYKVATSTTPTSYNVMKQDMVRAGLQLHFSAMEKSNNENFIATHGVTSPVKTSCALISKQMQASKSISSNGYDIAKTNTLLPTTLISAAPLTKLTNVNQKMPAKDCASTQHSCLVTPSFSDLRQKSVEIIPISAITRKSPSFSEQPRITTQSEIFGSNLYRIRQSGISGSNESLHSANSISQGIDSEDDFDSFSSSSESDCSQDFESGSEISDTGIQQKSMLFQTTATQRPPFVLNKPRLLLDTSQSSTHNSSTAINVSSSNKNQSPKVKIRLPTFNFLSCDPKMVSRGDTTDIETSKPKVPDLKSCGEERDELFKSKFIRALENPDLKEGLAVDEKSLRALLGEANCFYHNNKKYVLKRGLTKCKPKVGFIADVAETNGNLVSIKNIKDVNDYKADEITVQSNIEPRVSVTAIKRCEHKPQSNKKQNKKRKTFQQNGTVFDTTSQLKKSKCKMDDVVISVNDESYNKRHRRAHEIDKLVFQGAGGLTPIPDKALRDSDVFSNIKLRRRDAVKRGISDVGGIKNKNSLKFAKRKHRRELIKATNEKVITFRSSDNSIKRRLRKIGKTNKTFLSKRLERSVASGRNPCVRITAGVARPQLDTKPHEFDEVSKNSFTDRIEVHPSEDIICSVAPESKQSLVDQAPDRNGPDDVTTDEIRGDKDNTSQSTRSNVQQFHSSSSSCLTNKIPQGKNKREYMKNAGYNAKSKSLSSIDAAKGSTYDATYWKNDSVRSNSPLTLKPTLQKRRQRSVKDTVPSHTKSITRTFSKRSEAFNLVSCFPVSSALTLDAVFGDMQPAFTSKIKKGSCNTWKMGNCAKNSKQQIQRETWRNMTIDMFCNSGKS